MDLRSSVLMEHRLARFRLRVLTKPFSQHVVAIANLGIGEWGMLAI